MLPNFTPDWVVVLHTGTEAKGSLGSTHMVLSLYVVNPSASVPHIIFIFLSFCPLFCLCLPHHQQFPNLIQVQSSLLPPSLHHLLSWTPLCLQTQLQFWTSWDILVYSACCSDRLCHRWTLPYNLCIVLWLHPHNAEVHPVVETPQGLALLGGHRPRLWAKL